MISDQQKYNTPSTVASLIAPEAEDHSDSNSVADTTLGLEESPSGGILPNRVSTANIVSLAERRQVANEKNEQVQSSKGVVNVVSCSEPTPREAHVSIIASLPVRKSSDPGT
jgi:hypothetical protein